MLAKDMASSFFEFLHVNKQKTFRPKRRFPHGTLRYNLHKHAQATLHSGVDLKQVVKLPPNECLDDWLAVNTVDFFNRINLLYGILADSCTAQSCPTMSGGPKYEYLWQDGAEYKKPTRLPAKDYMHKLMDWIEERINDEKIFPSSTDIPFPNDFRQTCKKILSRLFRIFVHIYIHHFDRLVQIGAEPHANMLYKHYYYFVTEFNMVTQRELDALKNLTARLIINNNNNNDQQQAQQQQHQQAQQQQQQQIPIKLQQLLQQHQQHQAENQPTAAAHKNGNGVAKKA